MDFFLQCFCFIFARTMSEVPEGTASGEAAGTSFLDDRSDAVASQAPEKGRPKGVCFCMSGFIVSVSFRLIYIYVCL